MIVKSYINEHVSEWCPHCNKEVVIPAWTVSPCPNCNEVIVPCSICNHYEMNCGKCPFKQEGDFEWTVDETGHWELA